MDRVIRIVRYVTADGTDAFDTWFRLQSAEIRGGVFELRIPGYRVHYGRDGEDLVVLLAGGTKKRQTHDIQTAHALWKAYRQEKRHARQSP